MPSPSLLRSLPAGRAPAAAGRRSTAARALPGRQPIEIPAHFKSVRVCERMHGVFAQMGVDAGKRGLRGGHRPARG